METKGIPMKKINLPQLITTIEKKLLPKCKDPILCNQYAFWIVQTITGHDQTLVLTHQEITWNDQFQELLDSIIDKLVNQHMPLAYILGSVPFCGLEILVKPPVLIPRPETEEWCANLIEQLQSLPKEPLWILDLCTGSGCIALALADALPKAKIIATDINNEALALAHQNAIHNSISNVEFIYSDLFDAIPTNFKFDLIVGNPPYIRPDDWQTLDPSVTIWEDKNALLASDNGLEIIKRIIETAPGYSKNKSE